MLVVVRDVLRNTAIVSYDVTRYGVCSVYAGCAGVAVSHPFDTVKVAVYGIACT